MVKFIGITRKSFLRDYISLYRFTILERLLEQFETQTHAFINPKSWQDPYERYHIEKKYIINDKTFHLPLKERIFCVCFSGTMSSEAFWKVYAPKENGVRLTYRTDEFLTKLDTIKDCDIFIGKVAYQTTRVFLRLSADSVALIKEIENDKIGKQQLKLLLRKRVTFRYEDEVRIIAIPKNPPKNTDVWKEEMDLRTFIKDYLIDPRIGKYQYGLIKETMWKRYGIKTIHSQLYNLPILIPLTLK